MGSFDIKFTNEFQLSSFVCPQSVNFDTDDFDIIIVIYEVNKMLRLPLPLSKHGSMGLIYNLYRAEKKSLYVVARNLLLLLLNFSASPCLGPAQLCKILFQILHIRPWWRAFHPLAMSSPIAFPPPLSFNCTLARGGDGSERPFWRF